MSALLIFIRFPPSHSIEFVFEARQESPAISLRVSVTHASG
jgi:hypothetical protein